MATTAPGGSHWVGEFSCSPEANQARSNSRKLQQNGLRQRHHSPVPPPQCAHTRMPVAWRNSKRWPHACIHTLPGCTPSVCPQPHSCSTWRPTKRGATIACRQQRHRRGGLIDAELQNENWPNPWPPEGTGNGLASRLDKQATNEVQKIENTCMQTRRITPSSAGENLPSMDSWGRKAHVMTERRHD